LGLSSQVVWSVFLEKISSTSMSFWVPPIPAYTPTYLLAVVLPKLAWVTIIHDSSHQFGLRGMYANGLT